MNMKKYNGYSNWETRNVALWLGNTDEYIYKKWVDCKSVDDVRELVIELWPEGTPDMKTMSVWEIKPVNWQEVFEAK